MQSHILQIVFSFGSYCNGHFWFLVLCEDGTLYGYSHPNERRWSLEGTELRLHAGSGTITSRYVYYPDTGLARLHAA